MSEPTIEHEAIEDRLRDSARIESCPKILKEAADIIAVLRSRVGRLEEVAEVARFVLANEGLIRQDSFNRMTTALSALRSDKKQS